MNPLYQEVLSLALISLDNESHGVTFLFIWHLLVGVLFRKVCCHSIFLLYLLSSWPTIQSPVWLTGLLPSVRRFIISIHLWNLRYINLSTYKNRIIIEGGRWERAMSPAIFFFSFRRSSISFLITFLIIIFHLLFGILFLSFWTIILRISVFL